MRKPGAPKQGCTAHILCVGDLSKLLLFQALQADISERNWFKNVYCKEKFYKGKKIKINVLMGQNFELWTNTIFPLFEVRDNGFQTSLLLG